MTVRAIFCMLVLMGADLAAETALLDGFNARDTAVELSLVNALRPLIRAELKRNWKGMLRHLGDVEQASFLRLWTLRDDGEKLRPPLAELVKRVVDTVARKLRRERTEPLPREHEGRVEATQEESAIAHELVEIATQLPPEQRNTLLIHVRHVTEGGPALHLVLGIDEKAAHKRLVRAQAAAAELLVAKENEQA